MKNLATGAIRTASGSQAREARLAPAAHLARKEGEVLKVSGAPQGRQEGQARPAPGAKLALKAKKGDREPREPPVRKAAPVQKVLWVRKENRGWLEPRALWARPAPTAKKAPPA